MSVAEGMVTAVDVTRQIALFIMIMTVAWEMAAKDLPSSLATRAWHRTAPWTAASVPTAA